MLNARMRALVKSLAQAGMPDHQIAFRLGISLPTLREVFGDDIAREKALNCKPIVRFIVRDPDGNILHDSWQN